MGKILDPIIMNPEKDQIAKPYNKKDIQEIAYEVLADLGDEVINEAIASGKIKIPTGLGLIWMDNPSEAIGEERFQKLLTGKYCIGGWYEDEAYLYIPYHSFDSFAQFYRLGTVNVEEIYIYTYNIDNTETSLAEMIDNEGESYIKSGTALFDHSFQIKTSNDQTYTFSVISWRQAKYSNGISTNFEIISGIDALVISKEGLGDVWGFVPVSVYFEHGTNKLQAYQDNVEGSAKEILGITSIIEAITEL